jgi:hypothetical protein
MLYISYTTMSTHDAAAVQFVTQAAHNLINPPCPPCCGPVPVA